jgi:hypothetical protein
MSGLQFLLLGMCREQMGEICSLKHLLTFTGQHGVISQNRELLVLTTGKSSNPIYMGSLFPEKCLEMKVEAVKF